MMMRLLLTICLMIGLMMPCAWAEEKDASSSPLSQVTIEAEDWVEGDMYHIRYTFTNPTDEMIDEEIDFAEIRYDYVSKNNLGARTQCDETISHLTIAPHSSYAMTVSLKQPFPSAFNRLVHSTFYFKDDSYLDYFRASETPKSPFSLLPNVSPSGDVSLTIQNNSLTETITDLRRVLILTELQDKRRHLLRAEPYPLNIKPTEEMKIPLFTLDNTTDKKSSLSSFCISMYINGIPHTYNMYTYDLNEIGSGDTFEIRFISEYSLFIRPRIAKDGVFYLDESNLYAYIQVQDRHKENISAPNEFYNFVMDYFDKNACSQTQYFRIYPPSDIYPDDGATKYFTFKIPLPKDYCKLNPHKQIRLFAHYLSPIPIYLYPPSKLSLPVPKEQYVPLTNISTDIY